MAERLKRASGSDSDVLKQEDLRPELRTAEHQDLMVALLELYAGQVRRVDHCRRCGSPITLMDLTIMLHVFALDGAREGAIVMSLNAPRRTVRDALKRLRHVGLVVKHGHLYCPTKRYAHLANDFWPWWHRDIARVAQAYWSLQRSLGRKTP